MKDKNIVDSPYFKFLRFCLRKDVAEPESLANMDWNALYDFGKNKRYLAFCTMDFRNSQIQAIDLNDN